MTYTSGVEPTVAGQDEVAREHAAEIIDRLVDLLLVSGAEGSRKDTRESVVQSAAPGLETIVRHITTLQRAIFVDVLSCDLELYCPRSNRAFNPEYMDDLGDDAKEDDRLEVVLPEHCGHRRDRHGEGGLGVVAQEELPKGRGVQLRCGPS